LDSVVATEYFGCMARRQSVALVLGLGLSLLTIASATGTNQPAGVFDRSPQPYSLRVWNTIKVTGPVRVVVGGLTGIPKDPVVGAIGVGGTMCVLTGWKGAVHLSALPAVGTNATLVCEGGRVASIVPDVVSSGAGSATSTGSGSGGRAARPAHTPGPAGST
jgi:hypothetical protein